MKNQKLISVVVPFFNANDFIEDLFSGLSQNSEVIGEVIFVVDNGSDAPSIPTHDCGFEVTIVQTPYKTENGAGLLRPIGFDLAKFRFVMFLDPDDYYIPDALTGYVEKVLSQNLAFSFAGVRKVDNNGRLIGSYIPKVNKHDVQGLLKKHYTIYCVSVIVDKSRIGEIPTTDLRKRNDYFAWYHVVMFCLERELQWGAVDLLIVNHRFHANSLTSNVFSSVIWYYRFLRKINLSRGKSLRVLVPYGYNTFLRRILHRGEST